MENKCKEEILKINLYWSLIFAWWQTIELIIYETVNRRFKPTEQILGLPLKSSPYFWNKFFNQDKKIFSSRHQLNIKAKERIEVLRPEGKRHQRSISTPPQQFYMVTRRKWGIQLLENNGSSKFTTTYYSQHHSAEKQMKTGQTLKVFSKVWSMLAISQKPIEPSLLNFIYYIKPCSSSELCHKQTEMTLMQQ